MSRGGQVRAAAFALALGVVGGAPQGAAADDDVLTEPDQRFDLILPAVGFGGFFAPVADYSRGLFIASFEGRWTHSSGHGAMLRAAWGTTVWGSGYGGDLGYVYRRRLTGDRHLQLALATMIGPTIAALEHNEDTLPLGPHVGGHLSFSLDFCARNFIAALGVQYRLIVPTSPSITGGPSGAEHVLTATLGVGFTIY